MRAINRFDAVVAGHVCLDIIPQIPAEAGGLAALFAPGKLSAVGPAFLSTGGPVSNTGLALHRLGIATRLMGKVGDDLFGLAIRRIVAGYGAELADGMVVDPAVTSSYSVVLNVPGVDRIFLHHTGANDTFTADDVRYDLAAQARLFHFGYPPLMRTMYADGGRELAALLHRVKATGCATSLDMALPDPASDAGRADWSAILRAALPAVDIFAPSSDEILYMLRRDVFDRARAAGELPVTPAILDDLASQLLAWGARIVLLKLGDSGAYLRTAGREALAGLGRGRPCDLDNWAYRELWAPCFRAQVVGATGSGDATIAGFLSALLRGLAAEETLTAAVAVGACNVEAADALTGIRSWEETWARITAGWPRHIVTDPARAQRGWRWEQGWGLWAGPKDGGG
jgi:sugar/nucleoside kinase (ribokinase family)